MKLFFEKKVISLEDELGKFREIINQVVSSGDSTISDDGEEDEPFVLASQARMIYYTEDPCEVDWNTTVHIQTKDLYYMGYSDELDDPSEDMEINDSVVNDKLLISDYIPNYQLVKHIVYEDNL